MFPRIKDLIYYLTGLDLSLRLPTYTFFLVSAFILAGLVVYLEFSRKERQRQIPSGIAKETPYIMLITIVSGIIGTKIFSSIEYIDKFWANPSFEFFLHNGMSFYGGLIFATLALLIYGYYVKIPYPHGFDVAATSISVGYAVGRLGCHLSGDGCWGVENINAKPRWLNFLPDWAWMFNYPNNCINSGVPIPDCKAEFCYVLANPVFPTSLYESVFSFLLLLFLWLIRKRIKTPGYLFIIFLLPFVAFRFFIEYIRINPKYSFLGWQLSQAQIISIFLFVGGLGGYWYFRKNFENQKSVKV